MKPAHFAVATVAIIALVLGGRAYLSSDVGGSAPDVGYTLLDGTPRQLAHLRGKVVLVNFWATTCTSCVHEMPQLVSTFQSYRAQGFETLAVAMHYDAPSSVVDFAQSRQLPFGVAIDNTGVIARSFGNVSVTPTTVLINRHGEIVKRYVGEPDFVALRKLVEQLLAET